MSNLLKLDLQFFADGAEPFGAYDPASAYEGIPGYENGTPAQAAEPTNPIQVPINPESAQTQPDFLDFGGRKLPANEDLSGLHKDFTEQQRYITSLQEQVNAYKQLASMTQQPAQVTQPQEPQVSANVEEWNEEVWQKFYDKPQEILGSIVSQEVQKIVADKLDPIIQERQWNAEIQRMYDSYPDFEQFIGDVQALVQQQPERYADREGGLEEAYYRAKATKGMNAPSPEQLANDPHFIQQYVLSNPQVQTQFLTQYFQQKQQTNQTIPNVMGGNQAGFTPQTPDSSPQTLKEASRAFLKQLGHR